MGRGQNDKTAASVRTRSSAGGTHITLQQFLETDDPTRVGEYIELANGQLELKEGMPAGAIEGLAGLESVNRRLADGSYLVEFEDGSKVLVDLRDMSLLGSQGPDHDPNQLQAALLAALGHQAQFAGDDADPATLALGDAFSDFEALKNPETLAQFAELAQQAAEARGGELELGNGELQRSMNEILGGMGRPLSGRAARRARRQAFEEKMATAMAAGGQENAARALLHRVDEEGMAEGPSPEELQRRSDAAERLGGQHLIPELKIDLDEDGNSTGEYEIGEQESTFFDLLRNRLAVGQRGFALRGRPGTGKDTFAEQVAAIRGSACMKFNIGPKYSFEDAIGGEGLTGSPVTAVDPETGQTKVVGSATVSAEVIGPLTRALKEDCVIVIQEPEGMEDDAVRLHSAVGDRVGDPNGRYITINAPSGEITHEVNPEALIFFSYNSGEEDVRFKTALHDRMGNFDFEYPEPEAEARRMARMVTKMMGHQEEAPELQRDYSPEELLPMVRVMEQLRAMHDTNPETFVDIPGSRQAAHCYADLLLMGYNGDQQAPDTMSYMLRYLMPGSDNMSVDERDHHLREAMADEHDNLMEIANAARRSHEEHKSVAPAFSASADAGS